MKASEVTQEQFDDMLAQIVREKDATVLLAHGDVYSCLSEEYNNEVLERLGVDE